MGDERTLEVDGRPVAPVLVADTWRARARGMLGRRPLPEAMWFVGERAVHGVGMTRTLDVAFLAPDGEVVDVTTLRPFGATRPRRGAVDVVEAPRGRFAAWGVVPGARLGRR